MNTAINGIHYKTYGKNHGYTIVFLHGYLESSVIWDSLAKELEEEYFVVCIDLPGHGKSYTISDDPSLEKFGEAVISVLNSLEVKNFQLVGHSMGGYLALSMLENYPKRIQSLVLFHSHCFADSDEKKLNREREIELVLNGKKESLFNISIPRLYSNDNLETFSVEVEKSLQIALTTSDMGVVSALKAMKGRPDRSEILAKAKVPVLLIGGRKDNLIPLELMEKMEAAFNWHKTCLS
jgi:pimeloyl-ACP methyl ester carboxylesterase